MKLRVKEKKIKKKTTGNQTTENANRFENNVGACIICALRIPLQESFPVVFFILPENPWRVCLNVEDVAAKLFTQDATFIAHWLIANLKLEVRNRVCCFLHREDYGSKIGDTNNEEEEDEEEEEEGKGNEEEQD